MDPTKILACGDAKHKSSSVNAHTA